MGTSVCHPGGMADPSCNVLACPAQSTRIAVLSKLFRGMADPTRLAILQGLCKQPLRVVDLCDLTGRAQPNVSAHLANLRDVGLVVGQSQGRETYYSLTDPRMADLIATAEAVSGPVGLGLCQCVWFDPPAAGLLEQENAARGPEPPAASN
jgi:DNA-binding transcriptional ArsR family regulator